MSETAKATWVVIAAYNEAAVIGRVVTEVRRCGYQVVVIDDGSRDETGSIACRVGATVITHPMNLGQGAALQTGIRFALQRRAEHIVTFDADGQHHVGDIAKLISALDEKHVDFALGSRFLGAAVDMPLSRRMLLKAAIRFTRLTTGLQVTDTHNGLRAMTHRGAKNINLRQNRMAHASEFLDQVARSGLAYAEVPVTVEYTSYSLAKGQRISSSLAILLDLSAQRLQR